MADWIKETPGGVDLCVRVKPRSKKNTVEGADGCLVVRLTAPPVDNKANAALIALIAKTLRVPKSAVTISSGEKSRNKTVTVTGVTLEAVARALLPSGS